MTNDQSMRDVLQTVATHPAVRSALRDRAHRIAARARRMAVAEGQDAFADAIRVEEQVRPGTKAQGFRRPVARVIAGSADAQAVEFGGPRMPKFRLLQRASRQVS